MQRICFISGHLDISPKEWEDNYKNRIDKAIKAGCSFVVGDAKGTDSISADYLWEQGVKDVVIYHMFDKPRNNPGYPTQGGFKTDTERDEAMTKNSKEDIAWVRSEEESKKLYGKKYRSGRISGTQQNLNRRIEMK